MIINQLTEIRAQKNEPQRDPRIEILVSKINELQLQINDLKVAQKTEKISPFTNQVRTSSEPKNEPSKIGKLDRKIIAQTRSIKKDYIIHQIMDFIEKNSVTTKELETVIVKEKMLCGRTAFYDYLRELRNKNIIKNSGFGLKNVLVATKKT